MSWLIKNGTVVTAEREFVADVLCLGETIEAVGPDLEAPEGVEVIDATGKYVFPGFIDPHVHIYLPFMGTFAKDDYESASRAALMGGTTTLIEMCCPGRDEDPLEAFHLWKSKAEGLSSCDYTFHMGVTRFDSATASALEEIVGEGVASFKVFLAYQGAFGIDDTELYETLRLAKELGVIVTAHCENAALVAKLQAALVADGKTGPEWHEPSRPVQVEAEGCHHLMTFAEATGAHVYVVHTSCKDALDVIRGAKSRGVQAWVETVIPYLVLDKSYAERPDFEGAKWVMSPPIRDKSHQFALWEGLADGSISTVGTDHAPFDFETQKHMGHPDVEKAVTADFSPRGEGGNFTLIPNGIPSVEDRVNLLFTAGVKTGRIDLPTFVKVASTEAAKIFGLYPRKGEIAPGSDGDVVVYDPEYRGVISAETHSMRTDYSGFEGMEILGRPSMVTVRGQVMVREGKFVGEAGHGRFLARIPTHF
ncbi:dihydropyrimidinase [Haloferula luteola]|uniref:Dihydropyrimidinase n=1 Tax=Haloferula luteola TaxID=595692 RepID=A0A840V399_9BACT|nr:dihydropyrimidinase [Haloferula luteola]MBB5351516.1 dihydropyrimidinase [Haloferula luteola]